MTPSTTSPNGEARGVGYKTVGGSDRDCIHAIDLFFNAGAGPVNLPEVLVTDTGSYPTSCSGCSRSAATSSRPGSPTSVMPSSGGSTSPTSAWQASAPRLRPTGTAG